MKAPVGLWLFWSASDRLPASLSAKMIGPTSILDASANLVKAASGTHLPFVNNDLTGAAYNSD
jgi:hypothetical protein